MYDPKGKKLLAVILIFCMTFGNCYGVFAAAVDQINNASETKQDTPDANIFKLDGGDKSYILLDDVSGGYFVMTRESYGTSPIDGDATQKIDLSDENNIGYYIENRVLPKLETGISEHLCLWEWKVEAGDPAGNCPEEYSYRAKASVLSHAEWLKYSKKFGVRDHITEADGWWLRSARGVNSTPSSGLYTNFEGNVVASTTSNLYAVRPVFYLNTDFFAKVKLEVSSLGAAVKKVMMKSYSESQLAKVGYSPSEIALIKSEKPRVTEMVEYVAPKTDVDNIIRPQNTQFGLKFKVISDKPIKYTVEYSLDGENYESRAISVGYNQSDVFNFDITGKKGRWDMRIIIKDNERVVYNEVKPVVFMEDYKPQFMDELSGRGVCGHFTRDYYGKKDLEYIKRAGIKNVRGEIDWNSGENPRGVYHFSSNDWWNDSFKQMGVNYCGIVGYGNSNYYTEEDWAFGDKVGPHNEDQRIGYANYASQYANYLKTDSMIELWNEGNTGGFWKPDYNIIDYTDLVKTTFLNLRANAPSSKVAAFATSGTDVKFIQEGFELGLYPYCDYVSFHPYIQPSMPDDSDFSTGNIRKVKDVVLDHGGWKDLAITESGWSTEKAGTSPQKHAEAVIKQFIISEGEGVKKIYNYNFKNDGTNPDYSEDNFGMIENDYTPKKTYIAFCELNRFTAGAIMHGRVDIGLGDKSYNYVYAKDNEPTLVSWMAEGSTAVYDFGENAEVYDMYGNKLDTSGKTQLNSSPVYIKGIGREWFAKAANDRLAYSQRDFSARYGSKLSSSLARELEKSFQNSLALFGETGIEIPALEKVNENMDKSYQFGLEILEACKSGKYTEKETSQMLFGLYHVMEIWEKLHCALSNADPEIAPSMIADVEKSEKMAYDNYGKDGFTTVYSREILEKAVERRDDVKLLLTLEDNPAKGGILSGYSLMSAKLCGWFEKFSEIENPQNLSYQLFVEEKERLSFVGEDKKFHVAVQNGSDKDFTGELQMYDRNGTLLNTSRTATVAKGETGTFELSAVMQRESGVVDTLYTFKLVENKKAIRHESVIVKIQDVAEISVANIRTQIADLKELTLHVKNLFDIQQELRLMVDCKDIKFKNSDMNISLNSFESKEVTLPIEHITRNAFNHYVIQIMVYDLNGTLVSSKAVPLNFMVATKLDENLHMASQNGDVNDWIDAYPFYILPPKDPNNKAEWEACEVSARIMSKWTSDTFYVLVDVYDDMYNQKMDGKNMWEGDSIQIALDRANDDKDYYEFGSTLAPKGDSNFVWLPSNQSGDRPSAWARNFRSQEDCLTRYIIALPNTEVYPMKLQDGTMFGMNIVLNDSDGFVRDRFVEFTEGSAVFKDPSYWETFQLMPKEPSVDIQNNDTIKILVSEISDRVVGKN